MASIAVQPMALTVREAAETIRVSPSMIRKLIREEKLQASHIGDRVLIAPSSLKQLLKENMK